MEVRPADDRVAVVTGAAGCVGGRLVRRLTESGWKVAGIDLRPSPAELALQADVRDLSAMRAAAATIDDSLGTPRLLVTAASVYRAAPAGEMAPEIWRLLLDTQLIGTGNAVRAFVPAMLRQGTGSVVTLSSWLAQTGRTGDVYFATATGTILAFTKSLACEVARDGVRVNCIAVGALEQGSFSAAGRTGPAVVAPRAPDPDDVADTVLFLAEEGDFYVGQVFTPNCGAVI